MKIVKIAASTLVLFAVGISTPAYTQELSIGKYSGHYTVSGRTREARVGVELNIASIENGNVKGTVLRYGKDCRDSYPVEGTYKENKLELKSSKGGGAGDCTANFRVVVEGNKLTGTMGTLPVELSK